MVRRLGGRVAGCGGVYSASTARGRPRGRSTARGRPRGRLSMFSIHSTQHSVSRARAWALCAAATSRLNPSRLAPREGRLSTPEPGNGSGLFLAAPSYQQAWRVAPAFCVAYRDTGYGLAYRELTRSPCLIGSLAH